MEASHSSKRNYAIDYVKFLAVFLVMNSHMDICYERYQYLATGGAMGDALFFFASGFTLLLGQRERFDNWYKKRIRRIYPSIIAAAIFSLVIWRFHEDFYDVLIGKRYWFIGCILVYYFLFYPIKNLKSGKYLPYVLWGWVIVSFVIYMTIFKGYIAFYSSGWFRCFLFFIFMLQGAYMGKKHNSYSYKWYYLPLLILSVACWFCLCKLGAGHWYYFLSVIPLMGFLRYTYLFCTNSFFKRIYTSVIGGNVVYVISQLCLEVYLIQKFIFTDELNYLFPINIPIIMLFVIIAAYIVKILSVFISQTFDSKEYQWKELLLYKKS